MRSQGRQTAALQGPVRVLGRGRSGAEWLVANKAGGVFVHRNEWDAVIPEEERVYADALLQQHVDRLLDCPTEPWANTPLPAIGTLSTALLHRQGEDGQTHRAEVRRSGGEGACGPSAGPTGFGLPSGGALGAVGHSPPALHVPFVREQDLPGYGPCRPSSLGWDESSADAIL